MADKKPDKDRADRHHLPDGAIEVIKKADTPKKAKK